MTSGARAVERTAPAVAIKAARLAQNAAIARHDLDAIAALWTDDVSLCRGLGAQLSGKANYRQLFANDDPAAADVIVYERIPVSVDVAERWPLAFETGRWTGHRGSVHGPVVISGRYSAQWVQRPAGWLIRAEVFVALHAAGAGRTLQATP